ncbi:MAG: hypothetical protein VX923_02940 [Pseudomonadota bacterium]|nr:hypothetical protein [Pseudomonadota bacterium]
MSYTSQSVRPDRAVFVRLRLSGCGCFGKPHGARPNIPYRLDEVRLRCDRVDQATRETARQGISDVLHDTTYSRKKDGTNWMPGSFACFFWDQLTRRSRSAQLHEPNA